MISKLIELLRRMQIFTSSKESLSRIIVSLLGEGSMLRLGFFKNVRLAPCVLYQSLYQSRRTTISRCHSAAMLLSIMSIIAIRFSSPLMAEESFKVRAFHIDNRIQVMPPAELRRLAIRLKELDINTLVMEWEGSFPFDQNHVISNRFAYTKDEVKEFIRHCTELGIDVIPLQQCIGHLEYVLKHERYAALREDVYDVSQVCPLKQAGVLELYEELVDELIAVHPSKYFHIGGDETALLGHCPQCRAFVKKHGKSELFIRHIKSVAELLLKKGKIPVLWADIVAKHPEAIHELPPECILVNWNYGWDVNHFGNHDNLLESGHELWGALALRSHPDNFFQIGWKKHFENLEEFIPFMHKTGYKGIMMTSWSTSGVYTYRREPRKHIVEMFPVRHVYPMAGFDLLLEAYGDALKESDFDGHEFVLQYCGQHYGMSEPDAEEFWKGITASTPTLINGSASLPTKGLKKVRKAIEEFCNFLNNVDVQQNSEPFEHFRLMYDIRLFFLDVQIIRTKVEAMKADMNLQKKLSTAISRLQKRGQKLNQRFGVLHEKNLYPAAIEIEDFIRNRELDVLYKKVTKQR